jgi:WD40 repeat protein/tRNA A-37 threonylcarbamoyl transferase component Bud32
VEVPPALGRRIDEACDRFEAAWRAGALPRLEDFIAGWAGDERAALLRELVPLDADYRRQRGEPVALADYRGRFPELGAGWLEEHVGGVPAAEVTTAARSGETIREAEPLRAGRSFGDYEVLEEIGRGMGVVYRARQRRPNRVVALKMILAGEFASPDAVRRFRDEAENVARLDHLHIVQVFEVGEHNGLPYFSMKYIEGGSLARRLSQGPALQPRELATLMAKVARAVHHAHQRGILHRDIKPGNILLDAAGEPYVTDFGLAKQVEEATARTLSGVVVGTPAYMAREQAQGHSRRLTTAADVYGLGAVLYELLTGRPPFRGETALETLQLVLTEEPVPPSRLRPGVPRDLEVICLTCLRTEPEKRYESALELAEDLERWLAGEPIRKRAVGRVERTVRWVRRHPTGTALLAVIAATVLALLGGWAYFTTELQAKTVSLRDERDNSRDLEAKTARQLERTRRTLHTAQVWRATAVWEREPAQALRLLEDAEACPADLRDFAWRLYHRACHRQRHTLKGHASKVQTLAFSGDGKTLASADEGGIVKLWDVVAGRERVALLGHTGIVYALAFSPDRRTLASGGADKTLRLWDTATGRERACFRGHVDPIFAVTFRPDGKTVVAVDAKVTGFWEVGTGRLQKMVPHGPVSPYSRNKSTALTPDGSTLAVHDDITGEEEHIRLWDVDTGKELAAFHEAPEGSQSAIALSPDGRLVVLNGAQSSLRVWDVSAARPRCTLQDFSRGGTNSPAFSADSRTLAIGDEYGLVRLWDTNTGRHRVTFECLAGSDVNSLALSPDGKMLATWGNDDKAVKVWDIGMDLARAGVEDRSGGAPTLSRNGRYQAVQEKGGPFRLWDVVANRLCASRLDRSSFGPDVWNSFGPDVTISPDGRAMVCTCQILDDKGNDVRGEVAVWDVETGKARWRGVHTTSVCSLEYSSDGRTLMSGGRDGTVRLWNAADGSARCAVEGLAYPVTSLALTPDGRVLAAAGLTTPQNRPAAWEVRLWDVATGEERATFRGEPGTARALAVSPDGSLLAAAGRETVGGREVAVVRLWDLATGQERAPLRGRGEEYRSVAFTPDGNGIAAGAGFIEAILPGDVDLWDVATGQLRASLRGHPDWVSFVAFTPDGNTLISASDDGTVKVWDATPLPSAPRPDRE